MQDSELLTKLSAIAAESVDRTLTDDEVKNINSAAQNMVRNEPLSTLPGYEKIKDSTHLSDEMHCAMVRAQVLAVGDNYGIMKKRLDAASPKEDPEFFNDENFKFFSEIDTDSGFIPTKSRLLSPDDLAFNIIRKSGDRIGLREHGALLTHIEYSSDESVLRHTEQALKKVSDHQQLTELLHGMIRYQGQIATQQNYTTKFADIFSNVLDKFIGQGGSLDEPINIKGKDHPVGYVILLDILEYSENKDDGVIRLIDSGLDLYSRDYRKSPANIIKMKAPEISSRVEHYFMIHQLDEKVLADGDLNNPERKVYDDQDVGGFVI